ncbi:MAG: type I phosphomannose isomerase catalytic subunit [Candidatus Egerieousia sp.]
MLRPLKFEPIVIKTIWGGERWVMSSLPGRESVVSVSDGMEGSDAKLNLTELVKKYKADLVGEKVWKKYGETFPLLVKFIKAKNQLSVQVHPDDNMAARKGLPNGKTEMWYVLEAKNNPELLLGFLRNLDAEEFASIVKSSLAEINTKDAEQSIENVLNRFIARKGDSFFIPAGTVHSIGAGLDILEIQQTSDTTYRLYDFNRKDKNGQRRKLDLEDAIEAIDFSPKEPSTFKNVFKDASATVQLADCEYFTSQFINFAKMFGTSEAGRYCFYQLDYSKFGSFSIVVCVEGDGEMFFTKKNGETESVTLASGDVYLLPAQLGEARFRSLGNLQLVECHIR